MFKLLVCLVLILCIQVIAANLNQTAKNSVKKAHAIRDLSFSSNDDEKRAQVTTQVLFDLDQEIKTPQMPVKLSLSLYHGQVLSFYATVNNKPDSFEINFFTSGYDIQDDNVAAHFVVRFSEDIVVLNKMFQGKWANQKVYKNPLKANDFFMITIHIFENSIVYKVNDENVYMLELVVPLYKIKAFQFKGDVTVNNMNIGNPYPVAPFNSILPQGLWKKNDQIAITAIPTGDYFSVQLWGPDSSISYIMSVRFDEDTIVQNSWFKKDGDWGQELRQSIDPFKLANSFKLVLMNTEVGMIIHVNEVQKDDFMHRVPYSQIESGYIWLHIEGHINILRVEYISNPY